MRKFIVAALLLCSPFAGRAGGPVGPFGFTPGMKLSQLQKIGAIVPGPNVGLYRIKNAPKSHTAFEYYLLTVSPTHGLCKVSGVGNDVRTSRYGDPFHRIFQNMVKTLVAKYGLGEGYDFLRAESIWNEPDDWMMGLFENERVLMHIWLPNDSELPVGMSAMQLEADALDGSTAYFRLSFEFDNWEDCSAELQGIRNNSL